MVKKNNPFLTGTLILTAAGLLSRLIGFFYRAFLSRTFGAEGMGIYQLLAPVMALSFSLTAAGIQTAVSKFTASETSTGDYRHSLRVLGAGFFLSMPLSVLCTWFLYSHANFIAVHFLLEQRSAPLLRIFALSIPFCSVHSLANGYFYGIKRAGIPALTQVLEQLSRVGSVFLICGYLKAHDRAPQIACAVAGLAIGECFSTLISLLALWLRFLHMERAGKKSPACFGPLGHLRPGQGHGTAQLRQKAYRQSARGYGAGHARPGLLSILLHIFTMAAPLTASRIAVNLLQSVEAVSIPSCLVRHGFSQAQALSVYGVLTGMALPLIFFPSALVNSACVLLLPVISEADGNGNKAVIKTVIRKSMLCCALFGAACTVCFLLFGRLAGTLLFKSEMAGSFILTLSFICPLLYLSGALSSILHGLGKTGITFLFNMVALAIRLLFVFRLIPLIGIRGYLYGLLISQLLITILDFWAVRAAVRPSGS